MKVGVLSDIHGNLPALDIVLYKLHQEHNIDEIAVAGDLVGILGWPDEVTHRVKEVADYCVYGNHDAYIRDDYSYVPEHPSAKDEHRVVTSDLTESSVEFLHSLPEVVEIDDSVTMAHANPYVENTVGFPAHEYVDKRDWIEFAADHMNGELVIIGHTHEQGGLNVSKFDSQEGTIVNPGSVGAPYYKDAKYAIVDTETHDFSLHRAYYDESPVKKKLERLGVEPHNNVDSGYI